MSTLVQESEFCLVDGVKIRLDSLRHIGGLLGTRLVKARSSGQEVTLWIFESPDSIELANRLVNEISRLAHQHPKAQIVISTSGTAHLRPAKQSGKGGAA